MHDDHEEVDVLLLVWSTPLFAFNGVRESLCCAQSCRKLREACQEPLLWREHAFLLHYIQPVDEQQYVAAQAADVINCLGWQLFVRLNAASRKGVLVRLAGHDLRLPLYSFQDPLLRVKALYFLLRKIFAKLPGSWPFRLRWLQWGGRPGHLVERQTAASVLRGSRLFIEFADDTLQGWKLPPHIFHAGIHFNLEDMRSSLWRPIAPQLAQGYLLRVVSSMLPSERWLHLSAEADLWNLIEEVCILLRHQTHLAASSRPLHFRLADMQAVSVVDPDTRTDGHPLLWDLAWAQCETIYVEVEKNTSSGGDGEILLVDLKREGEPGRCVSPCATPPVPMERRDGAGSSGEVEVATSSDERIVPHLPPLLIPGTQKCRQFEFHPEQPDVLLIGDKDGCAKILVQGPEETLSGPATQVDSCALLALSWLRRADVAVCGAACSGTIQFLRYFPDSRSSGPALANAGSAKEKFPKLSSLSVNCSDNFLLASGISSSISIFDIETGNLFCRGSGVHEHFINISRFSNTSPHVFATASFDHSCKIWDLRRPLRNPVKTLQTEGHNVMCTFSPDDRYFLASGVDTRMTQFEVATWESRSMPLRKAIHQGRYRRSAYLANSKFIVTGSTEESHVHLLSVTGRKLECVDFEQRLEALAAPRRSHQDLIRGTVVLDDREPLDRSASPSRAYVQSIRAHPVIPNRVGVLMALPEGDSHIAMLHLDQKEMKP